MGLVTRAAVAVDAFALDEVKTYLRIDGESEDSALAALIASAIEQCEAYVGVSVLQRAMSEVIVPCAGWQLLVPMPVRVISGVAALAIGGATTALPASAYEIDIDAEGRGRVRFLAPVPEKRVLVSLEVGLAANWAGLSESLRHGIVRLVAGAVLHWCPHEFWAATPDELAAIFEVLAGDRPVPGGAEEIARLMEVFPDG